MRHPAPCTCPACGGALRRIGEEVTETLDYVPGRFKVIRHIREKLSCRACDTVVAAPAPDHAIARGRAGAGLLAHIVVSKYDDHLPLYRQAEIFARDGRRAWRPRPCPAGSARRRRRCSRWSTRSPPTSWRQRHLACRRHAGAGAGAGHRQDQDRPAMDLRSRRAAICRRAPAGGAVLLLAGPQGRASAGPSEGLPRRHPRRRLCRVQRAVRRRPDRRGRPAGRMCGASSSTCTPPPARRSPRRRSTASASSTRSRRRSTVLRPIDRRRERQQRSKPIAEALAAWADEHRAQAVAQIRARRSLPLYAGALDRAGALLRRRPPGARQQPRRARAALRRDRPQELSVRRLRCRRPPRRRDLLADRKRQAQRPQSAALPRRRARPHRRPSGPAHRRTLALELAAADATRAAA